jgi:hypothetical protein
MMQMLFSLHFQSQLRRIRPELIAALENAIVRAAEISGGKVWTEPRCIAASFEEHTMGFALDMLLALKAVQGAVERALPELYGHTCVFGPDIARDSQALLNHLSLGQASLDSGIWCSQALWSILDPYAVFAESPFSDNFADYRQLRELKPLTLLSFDGDESPQNDPQGEVDRSVPGEERNTLLVGTGFSGKREAFAKYVDIPPGFPPLVFRFGCGGTGLSCLSDALEDPIRDLIPPEKRKTLEAMGAFLFKERLEDEFTPFAVKRAGHFMSLLLESYADVARSRRVSGTILVEDIHKANPVAARVFVDAYAGLSPATAPRVLGTCRDDPAAGEAGSSLGIWDALFPLVERFLPPPEPPENSCVPKDVAEVAYAIALFNRYFPASLTFQLFEEEGKNPGMINLALGMLSSLGRPDMASDTDAGELALGDRSEEHTSELQSP